VGTELLFSDTERKIADVQTHVQDPIVDQHRANRRIATLVAAAARRRGFVKAG
jgi:hypothetical protein